LRNIRVRMALAVLAVCAACHESGVLQEDRTAVDRTVRPACQATMVVLSPDASVLAATEWSSGVLLGAGCRDELHGTTDAQKAALAAWFGERVRRDWSVLRNCHDSDAREAPDSALLAEAKRLLPGIEDWCWYPMPERNAL